MGKQQFFFRWTTYSFIVRPVLFALFLGSADWLDGQMTWEDKVARNRLEHKVVGQKLFNKSKGEESFEKVVLLSFIRTRARDSFDCNVV